MITQACMRKPWKPRRASVAAWRTARTGQAGITAASVQRGAEAVAARQVMLLRVQRDEDVVRTADDLAAAEEAEVARVHAVVAVVAQQQVLAGRSPGRAEVAERTGVTVGQADRVAQRAVAFGCVMRGIAQVVVDALVAAGRVAGRAAVDEEHV